MLKIKRDYTTDAGIESRELNWWNSNAEIISKVWEMHEEFSSPIRKNYLKKAKNFLSNGTMCAKVLELGCGSGWVGQSIAGQKLNIIGVDFSESQIKLAKMNAKRRGVDSYCEYRVSGSLSPHMDEIDGIMIHCFLHHLNEIEIEKVLNDLSSLRKGTKIWIYEPAFFSKQRHNEFYLSKTSRICRKVSLDVLTIMSKIYSKYNLLDKTVYEKFLDLCSQAERNGWYLSPKEVPFDVDEFSSHLEKHFHIISHYWGNIYIISWVFESNLLKSRILRKIIAGGIIPFLSLTDNRLSREEKFLEEKIVAPIYAFHIWECIL
jgi:SAM-dependent methyltransferase